MLSRNIAVPGTTGRSWTFRTEERNQVRSDKRDSTQGQEHANKKFWWRRIIIITPRTCHNNVEDLYLLLFKKSLTTS